MVQVREDNILTNRYLALNGNFRSRYLKSYVKNRGTWPVPSDKLLWFQWLAGSTEEWNMAGTLGTPQGSFPQRRKVTKEDGKRRPIATVRGSDCTSPAELAARLRRRFRLHLFRDPLDLV